MLYVIIWFRFFITILSFSTGPAVLKQEAFILLKLGIENEIDICTVKDTNPKQFMCLPWMNRDNKTHFIIELDIMNWLQRKTDSFEVR